MTSFDSNELTALAYDTTLNVFSHLFPEICYEWRDALFSTTFVVDDFSLYFSRNWEGRTSTELLCSLTLKSIEIRAQTDQSCLTFRLCLTPDNEWAGVVTISPGPKSATGTFLCKTSHEIKIEKIPSDRLKEAPAYNWEYHRNRTYLDLLTTTTVKTETTDSSYTAKLNEQFITELIGAIPMYKNEKLIIAAFARMKATEIKEKYDATNAHTIIPEYRRWKASNT